MDKLHLSKLASEYAKEIVIAKMSSSSLSVNADCGKYVADFYKGIYEGILAALEKDLVDD